jgi:hypothetical protein
VVVLPIAEKKRRRAGALIRSGQEIEWRAGLLGVATPQFGVCSGWVAFGAYPSNGRLCQ